MHLVRLHVPAHEVSVSKDVFPLLDIQHNSPLTTRCVAVLHRAAVDEGCFENGRVHFEDGNMCQLVSSKFQIMSLCHDASDEGFCGCAFGSFGFVAVRLLLFYLFLQVSEFLQRVHRSHVFNIELTNIFTKPVIFHLEQRHLNSGGSNPALELPAA